MLCGGPLSIELFTIKRMNDEEISGRFLFPLLTLFKLVITCDDIASLLISLFKVMRVIVDFIFSIIYENKLCDIFMSGNSRDCYLVKFHFIGYCL